MRRALLAAGAGLAARELVRRRAGYDLRGKVALVTGGSRGLGFAIAGELIAEGARVVICGRDQERLERARALLAARDGDVRAIRCDVSSRAEVERMIGEVGRIDVLVNNAGVIAVGPIETTRVEDFEEMHAIMFWGVVYPTLAVLPQMTGRGEGRIANVTSIGGKVSVPFLLSYNAAKFAAVGFSEGLRTELAGKGVSVTTVVPGLMRTGSYVAALFKGQRRTLYSLFTPLSATPLSTISGRRAARKIVAAIKRGDPELILTAHANLAARVNGAAPATTQRVLGLVARSLPKAGGTEPVPGWAIDPRIDDSALLTFGRKARADLNQP
ncbi:MAG: SDR family NAD(P)-dependent oxidoreductase [Actinobacteria bacterium]|nr:MAG: SDR family NAD(P)-dependent oxidoreductase [Actinomycetota bacterium]